jgi:hypothetical protein
MPLGILVGWALLAGAGALAQGDANKKRPAEIPAAPGEPIPIKLAPDPQCRIEEPSNKLFDKCVAKPGYTPLRFDCRQVQIAVFTDKEKLGPSKTGVFGLQPATSRSYAVKMDCVRKVEEISLQDPDGQPGGIEWVVYDRGYGGKKREVRCYAKTPDARQACYKAIVDGLKLEFPPRPARSRP